MIAHLATAGRRYSRVCRGAAATAVALAVLLHVAPGRAQQQRVFATPEEAVKALTQTVLKSDVEALLALFGPDGRDLIASSDPATAQRNRDIFIVAAAESWRLVDKGADRKELVVGNEKWPFPVPLVRRADGWMFDTAAGKEEVLIRRIGRNELAVIGLCETYVKAQRVYAKHARDGKPAGIYARRFASEPGRQNGLYWPTASGQPRSPLGDLVAQAAAEGQTLGAPAQKPQPFHGYYFRILEGQGKSAPGGAKSYVVNGDMTGGFALIAWPAHYDESGIMTFIVNQDGLVHEKDLGSDTAAKAAQITVYDPDRTWHRAETLDIGAAVGPEGL